MAKWISLENMKYIMGKVKALLNGKVDKVEGKGLSANDYTTPEKTKLAGIAEGANKYVHPKHTAKAAGLYKVTVDNEGHVSAAVAAAKADITALGIPAQDTQYSAMGGASTSAAGTQGLVPAPSAGSENKFLKGDGTWAIPPGSTQNDATQTTHGLMSAADKKKLDGVAEGANKYIHPSHTAKAAGLYKVTVDAQGHVSAADTVTKADITALGIPAQDTNTTYNPATASANGLMSAADKSKLDAFGAASTYAKVSALAEYAKKTDITELTNAEIDGIFSAL